VIHAIEKPEDLNTSALELFGVLLKNTKNDEEVVDGRWSWVDVRDIAEAHVVALEKPEAGGERILFSAGKLPPPPRVIEELTWKFRTGRLARLQ
jgi:nucleoside-diphosphate-sugar epimerase